jgi:signal transduction histidine kinase
MRYIDADIEDVVGTPFWETQWWPEDLRSVIREKIEQAASGEYVTYEADLVQPDGDAYSVSGVIRPVTDDEERIVSLVVSARDITEQRRKTRELAESEARYQSLIEDVLDTSEVGTFILNCDCEVVWMNATMETYYDLDREQVLGSDKRQLIDDHISDIVEQSSTFKRRLLSAYEDNGRPLEFECRVLPGPGREELWLKHWSKPIESGYYAGGRIEHYTNITEQKRRTQQLEAFDRVLRHNLRNSMNVILGGAERIDETADEDLSAVTDSIIESGQQLLSVTEKQREVVDLLTNPPTPRPANITNLVHDVAEQYRATYPDAEISVQAPEGLEANVIPVFEQAVEELLENAIVHGCDGASTVELSATEEGDSVQLAVSDSGSGIPEPEQAILRGEGEGGPLYHGSGMGLWLVNRFVSYCNGYIEYHHDEHGATVQLMLEKPPEERDGATGDSPSSAV